MEEAGFSAVLQSLQTTLGSMQGLLQDTRDRVVKVEAHMEAQAAHRAEVAAKLEEHGRAITDLQANAVSVDAVQRYRRWLIATCAACVGSCAAVCSAILYAHGSL